MGVPRKTVRDGRQFTANQLVAMNITTMRKRRGWTQEDFAERLEPVLGDRWSIAVVSAAERSVTGKRVREFTADELVALARTFEVPIGSLFLMTADEPSIRLKVPDHREGLSSDEILKLAVGTRDEEIQRSARAWAGKAYELVLESLAMVESPDVARARRTVARAEELKAAEAAEETPSERGATAASPFVQTEEDTK